MSRTESVESSKLDRLAKTKLFSLGIDLGGTKIRAAVVSNGQIVGQPRQISTPSGRDTIIDTLGELIEQFQKKYSLAGVGLATAGIVDCRTGEVIGSTGNIPGWSGTPVKRLLESRVLMPVHVDNDANAAAYGESVHPSVQNKSALVGVTLGTGIGGGLILDGKPYRGSNWGAGEIGHIKVSQDNKRLCTCGLFDCWEAYGSGRGILLTATELLEGVGEEQTPLAKGPHSLSTYAIFAAAGRGDIFARKVVDRWLEHIAQGLVNIAHILNPDCFVISGGLSESLDLERLKELVQDRCLPRIADSIDLRKTSMEGNAAIIGAAQFVVDHLLTPGQ